jgi:signal transduction histidine kinase
MDGGGSQPIPDADRRFRALAVAALENQQSERGKVARLLHDEVAQLISAAGLQLDILRMDLEDKVPAIASRTADIQDLLERVVNRIRDLSYELNPDIVERVGLQPALDLLVGRFRKSFSGTLRLIYDSSVRLPGATGAAMQRIAEEALINALRHAQCNQIEIIVNSTREGVALQVRDDGTGFDYELAKKFPRGLGLLIMDHCATNAGLRFNVSSNEGGGVTVRAIMAKHGEKAEN